MKAIAKFEKVSREQFNKDFLKNVPYKCEYDVFEKVKLPVRSSTGSAGYDFVSPIGFTLGHGESVVIPTGIRCKIDDGWMLGLYPRSGLGFKTHVRLANTVGVIDSDYYYADNEGHIMVKLVADRLLTVNPGDRICQGIFTEYGITEDDECEAKRTGGFGSSGA